MSYIILYDCRNTKHRIKIKLFIKISIIYGISNLKSKKKIKIKGDLSPMSSHKYTPRYNTIKYNL